MLRQDAEKLVGTVVSAWTSANGTYAGTLIEVLPTRPWRARVRVTGWLAPPVVFEYGRAHQRRGTPVGGVVEVGGVNMAPLKLYEVPCMPTDIWRAVLHNARQQHAEALAVEAEGGRPALSSMLAAAFIREATARLHELGAAPGEPRP